MKVKEESEKVGLKLNIQKMKIMAYGPITSWEIDGETVETVSGFIFLGSKITADGDCSHEIKRRLLLGRNVMTNLDSILKAETPSQYMFRHPCLQSLPATVRGCKQSPNYMTLYKHTCFALTWKIYPEADFLGTEEETIKAKTSEGPKRLWNISLVKTAGLHPTAPSSLSPPLNLLLLHVPRAGQTPSNCHEQLPVWKKSRAPETRTHAALWSVLWTLLSFIILTTV